MRKERQERHLPRPSQEAALRLLTLAISRIEADKEIIRKMRIPKRQAKRAIRLLSESVLADPQTKEKKALLHALSRSLAKTLSLKKRGVRRCVVLAAASLSILAGSMASVRDKGYPAPGNMHQGRETPEHRYEQNTPGEIRITDPLRVFLSFCSDDRGRPSTLLLLRFHDGEQVELSASLSKEKELYDRAAVEIVARYENALPGINSSSSVNKALTEFLTRLGRERIFAATLKGSIENPYAGYASFNMVNVISRAIQLAEESPGISEREEKEFDSQRDRKKERVKRVIAKHMGTLLSGEGDAGQEERIQTYVNAIYSAHRSYGISPFLITAIIDRESAGKERAVSPTGQGYGLMQVNWNVHKKWVPDWFSDVKTLEDVLKPENNVLVGTAIYKGALKRAKGDHEKALMYYLGGDNPAYARCVLRIAAKLEESYQEEGRQARVLHSRTEDFASQNI